MLSKVVDLTIAVHTPWYNEILNGIFHDGRSEESGAKRRMFEAAEGGSSRKRGKVDGSSSRG